MEHDRKGGLKKGKWERRKWKGVLVRKDNDLKQRTKRFALRIIRLFRHLPKSIEAQIIGKQLLRSATSVAANYREASRGRSRAEVASKLGIVEQELDESLLWLELLVESETMSESSLAPLRQEADELVRIIVTSIRNLKAGKS